MLKRISSSWKNFQKKEVSMNVLSLKCLTCINPLKKFIHFPKWFPPKLRLLSEGEFEYRNLSLISHNEKTCWEQSLGSSSQDSPSTLEVPPETQARRELRLYSSSDTGLILDAEKWRLHVRDDWEHPGWLPPLVDIFSLKTRAFCSQEPTLWFSLVKQSSEIQFYLYHKELPP